MVKEMAAKAGEEAGEVRKGGGQETEEEHEEGGERVSAAVPVLFVTCSGHNAIVVSRGM
jgi:predicted amidohydrolase YtcJ